MSPEKDRVVVLVTPTTYEREGGGKVAVRFDALGLTGYGATEEAALDSLKQLLRTYLQTRRQDGTLFDALERAGVEWKFESDYTGSVPVEHLDENPAEVRKPARWRPKSPLIHAMAA